MVRAVLFDLDGTLIDPSEATLRCLRHALALEGLPCPDSEMVRRFIGPPLSEAFSDLLGTAEPARITRLVRTFRERYAEQGVYEAVLLPGARQALEEIALLGIPCFIATSKPEAFARRTLAHLGVATCFADIAGCHEDGAHAGKAEIIGTLLLRHRLHPHDCLMVGDRSYDIEGAQACGTDAVGVLFGFGSRSELLAAGARTLAENYRDVLRVVRQERRQTPQAAAG